MLTSLARRPTVPQDTPKRSSIKTWDFLFQFTRRYRCLQTLLYTCIRIIIVVITSPTSDSDYSNTSEHRIEVLHHFSKPSPSNLQDFPPLALEAHTASPPLHKLPTTPTLKPSHPSSTSMANLDPHRPIFRSRRLDISRLLDTPAKRRRQSHRRTPALTAPQSKSVSRVEYSVVRAWT